MLFRPSEHDFLPRSARDLEGQTSSNPDSECIDRWVNSMENFRLQISKSGLGAGVAFKALIGWLRREDTVGTSPCASQTVSSGVLIQV